MNVPFKLDDHPRRPRPALSAPPADYFDQLPTRVMARLPRAEASGPAWGWLGLLPAPLRTALASAAVLGGFAASFWLAGPAARPATVAAASLDTVPHTELVGYLLHSGARVETTDLAVLTAANPGLASGFLRASDEELTEMLDAQPTEETTYL